MTSYTVTYSIGTSRHDERRYVVRGIPADQLTRRIDMMQRKGKVVYSVARETEFAA